jgi:predicted ATPase
MLTRLRLKNFKAWQDSGDIRLAPLTVLFGANSAGKTSIPQLLLLLKQTAESPDRQRALQLGDSRTLVDLGTYDDVVHNHDTSQPMDAELDWTLSQTLEVTDPQLSRVYRGTSVSFQVSIEADKRHQPLVRSLRYGLSNGEGSSTAEEEVLDITMERRESGSKYDLASQHYSLLRQQGRPWPLPEPVRFYGFPDEATAHYQNTAFLSDMVLELERMLKSVFYLGPLREYPKRLYLWSGETPDHVGIKGDRAVEAILAAGGRTFNWKSKQRTKSLAELVAERLHSMGLISEFQVKALGQHRKEYEVLVRTGSKLPEVKLTDVGFGVSQVLPVIVEALYVPRRSIVILEQPEIHLHPRVQADLADLFVDAIRARENGVPRECQFIVESHSEHFLRRLQRRIAEEELSTDDAALYFVHTDGAAARIEALKVDLYGNILNWPDGFFGDEMADLVARSQAQARRTALAKGK